MADENSLWSDKLSVGVPYIDEHHKTLLKLLLKTKNAIESRIDRNEIRGILSDLLGYTKYHFLAEERLMMECKYPRLADQKADHAWFVSQLENSLLAMNKDTKKLTRELFSFLKDWYINHIIGSDLDIREYIEKSKEKILGAS